MSVTLDPSKLLTLHCRAARKGSIKLIFKNVDESAFDISNIDFSLSVKRWLDDAADVIELTIGDGLTIQGDDSNELLIDFDEEKTALSPSTYYWQLINNTTVKTWLNGDFIIHNGKHDGVQGDTVITIKPEGDSILIMISDPVNISDIDGGNL